MSGQGGRMREGSFGRAVTVLTGILMHEGRVLSGIARGEEQAHRVLCSVRSETSTARGLLEVSFAPQHTSVRGVGSFCAEREQAAVMRRRSARRVWLHLVGSLRIADRVVP